MKILKILFTSFLINIIFINNNNSYSQRILLEQDVLKDTIKKTFGPNLKNFIHFYLGYGFIVGKNSQSNNNIIYGKSNVFEIGVRYKYKLSNYYSIGSTLSYNTFSYCIKQDSNKIIPNNKIHQKETLIAYTLSYSFYNRFNYGKRGNYIGNFIDLGINGEWCFTNRHFFKDNLGSGIIAKTSIKGLRFYEPFYYNLYGNIGFNRIVLTCKYRMSNMFKSKYNYPQMPPFTIGTQIGLH
ncbi:MAG TPA: hypothetical protein P5250_04625 [Bacteroidales bacterium]|nr:hypothetical protein [Bacteroidales bacterium]